MKQKILFLLVTLFSTATAWADFTVNGLKYKITSEDPQTVELSGYVGEKPTGELVIPATVNGYSVTSIGPEAFQNCSGLISVEIPNSVTTIRWYAFVSCSGLTSIEIPNSVTDIGIYAFDGCCSLTSIKIPGNVTDIVDGTFYGCSGLTNIEIPNSVTSIGNFAFQRCSSLTRIEISDNVTDIGDEAFVECTGLTSIVVADGNTVYDSRDNCNAIIRTEDNTIIVGCKNMVIPSSVTSIGEYVFSGNLDLTSIEIPDNVTSIGLGAFAGCSNLTSIKIHDDVTSIGARAFYGCSSLTNIEIPNSVTRINYATFQNCIGLTSVTIPSSVTYIESSAFRDCSGLTSIEIPSSVTYIDDDAFSGCSRLASIEIPDNVTSLFSNTFQNCSSLTSIKIPDRVRYINDGAFRGCSGLTSITIPDSVIRIGNMAFMNCSGLKTITIGNSVTEIDNDAFYDCSNVTDVYCYADPETLIWYITDNQGFKPDKETLCHVSDISEWEEKFAGINVTFVDDLDDFFVEDHLRYRVLHPTETRALMRKAKGRKTVELVGYETEPTGAVDIPANVKHDGVDYAVTSIGENAFTNCSGMTSVTIPSSITNIKDGAFEGCTGMTDVYCKADPTQLTWSADAQSFMNDKETKFHVDDISAWSSFADANVTFVGDMEEIETGIDSLTSTDTSDGAWYTLDGQKLDGEPTAPGVYIVNGKKVYVK